MVMSPNSRWYECESLFSLDDLFNRMTVSEVLSQVVNLKQQGILHQVKPAISGAHYHSL